MTTSTHAPGRPQLGASLSGSLRLLRERLAATIALGAGIVLALLSVCCGIGVVMAPWLLCELLALQLGQAGGRPLPHSRAWISAGVILLGAVLLTASVGWLSWLGLSADGQTPLPTPAEPASLVPIGSAGDLLAVASALVSLLFVLPFLYAPLILLESRDGPIGAVLESARLVARGGALAHVLLSLCVNAVQVLPALLAALSAGLLLQDELGPLWVLFSLPLLSISVPVGQGMLVSAYAERRAEVASVPEAALRGESGWRPARRLIAIWTLLVTAPVLSFAMLGASLVRPSRLPEGRAPDSAETVAALRPITGKHSIHPPGSALEIEVDARAVRVGASDGGGAGRLTLRSDAPIEALRVVRVRELYGIEVMQRGEPSLTFIDRAGVRQDDDLRARLLDRVPSWALLAMLASLLSTACVLLPVLAALADLRRLYARSAAERGPPEALAAERRRMMRRSVALALALGPLAALSFYWGTHALIGS
jgi:hypothetical protein